MNKQLIERLRKTASKGVSAWGDLQMEAADTIESLQAELNDKRESLAMTLQEVDALKAAPQAVPADESVLLTALKEITEYTYQSSYCGGLKNIACRCNSDCPIVGVVSRARAAIAAAAPKGAV